MNVQDEGVQGYALGAVFGVVGLVLAGVIALACFHVRQVPQPSVPPAQRLAFEADGVTLSAEASDLLAHVADAARENAQTVIVTGVQSPQSDAGAAQRRAQRVRHALVANGVPPSQLILAKPVWAANATDGRSVELRWGNPAP